MSEYALQTPPLAHHFPERNRLISGASAAVIVMKQAKKWFTDHRAYGFGTGARCVRYARPRNQRG
ncbi:MAG: hypothetical protein CM15mP68_7370 [Pseudomonadota bacterium]|nr:MAG: hypothetical protein CM15mP68_7370 [Pseudomonadota bacterium]